MSRTSSHRSKRGDAPTRPSGRVRTYASRNNGVYSSSACGRNPLSRKRREESIVKEEIGVPTRLISVDEADRLMTVSQEQVRETDAGDVGLVLSGSLAWRSGWPVTRISTRGSASAGESGPTGIGVWPSCAEIVSADRAPLPERSISPAGSKRRVLGR